MARLYGEISILDAISCSRETVLVLLHILPSLANVTGAYRKRTNSFPVSRKGRTVI